MTALSVRQPFAELIAAGRKTIEVRSRRTRHRGPLAICAAGSWHKLGIALWGRLGARGVSVCHVNLVDCRPLAREDLPLACLPDDFDITGQFAWVLRDAHRLEPFPVRGKLGLFNVDTELRFAGY